jgi:hypothetical protein
MKYLFCVLATFVVLYSCKKNSGNNGNPFMCSDNNIVIKGDGIINCNNLPVAKGGSLAFYINGKPTLLSYKLAKDSFAIYYFLQCNSPGSLQIVASDANTLQRSDTITIPLNSKDTLYHIGALKACGYPIDSYVKYSIDDTDYTYVSTFEDSLYFNPSPAQLSETGLKYLGYSHNGLITYLIFPGDTIGTFIVNDTCGFSLKNYTGANLPSTGTVTYTYYGNRGDYIEGNFNIPFTNSFNNIMDTGHLFKGSFRLQRR